MEAPSNEEGNDVISGTLHEEKPHAGFAYEEKELPETDEIISDRIAARKRSIRRRRRRRKRVILLLTVLAMVFVVTMCGREVFILRAENRALKTEQEELIRERDSLKQELENTGDREYIKEQARKQLKLLDPGEILFIFKDDKEKSDGND